MPECLTLKKERKEDFFKISFIKYSSFVTLAKFEKSISFEDDFQTVSLERVDFSVPIYIIVNDHYEIFSNLAADIDNKCNMVFIRSLLKNIIDHFYHLENQNKSQYLRHIIPKIAHFYDYAPAPQNKNLKSDFQIDLTILDDSANEFKYGRN